MRSTQGVGVVKILNREDCLHHPVCKYNDGMCPAECGHLWPRRVCTYKKTEEIEVAIARHFGVRQNIIVPNVCWGFNIHECDLLIISKAGYLTEIEIKVSLQDLKKDSQKWHSHKDNRIKQLYFAFPAKLAKHIQYVPAHAGVIIVSTRGRCTTIANPKTNANAKPLCIDDQFKIARLGTMRIWSLKSFKIGG